MTETKFYRGCSLNEVRPKSLGFRILVIVICLVFGICYLEFLMTHRKYTINDALFHKKYNSTT
jgi:hypothetical protein